MEQYKTVMFLRQFVLNNLDPDCSRLVEELRTILQEIKEQYLDLIEKKYNQDSEMEIEKVLEV
jgi:hypothetical protein